MVKRVLETSYRAARRIVVATVGATVLAIGLALTVLPGPAFVVIPLGLAILGIEFAFARRWLRALKSGANAVLGRNGGGGGSSPPSSSLVLLWLLLPLLGAGCGARVEIGLPDARAGELRLDVELTGGASLAGTRLFLDGEDVSDRFVPGGPGLVGFLPVPPAGPHRLAIFRPLFGSAIGWTHLARFESPAAAPELLASQPGAGATVPASAWIELVLAASVDPAAAAGWGFEVECGGKRVASRTHLLGPRVIVNPTPALPPGRSCRVGWRAPEGHVAELLFSSAPLEASATAHYDRSDPYQAAPFPDDYWLVPDASTPSGRRVALELGPYAEPLQSAVIGVAKALGGRDGWSPVQPFVLTFSDAVDTSALPADEASSRDPAAALALFDMDPASPQYGQPVGFTARARKDVAPDGTNEHSLLLFPAEELREGGRYALAVTRRLHAAGRPDRPFGPSPFLRAVLSNAVAGEPPAVARARERMAPVYRFLAEVPELPIPPEDLALALPVSIRSERFDPSDWVSVKEQLLAADPPQLEVSRETVEDGDRVLRGVLRLPSYLTPDLVEVTRDPRDGRPRAEADDAVPFVLRIPGHAQQPLPIVIYQHGSPGSPEEINAAANRFLLDAGYALIGIEDFANRRFGANFTTLTLGILLRVASAGHVPLAQLQTHADLLGLLRAIEGMGVPDSFPEIDSSRIFYRGISFGAHHALGFLPLAPELTAAVAVVGGGRFFENTLHGIDFFGTLAGLQAVLPDATPSLLLVGFAALQNDADRDDPQYLARHLYREPLAVSGQGDREPPSLLWIEGVGDRVVSNTATRAAAAELGLPQVAPLEAPSSFQEQVEAPVRENIRPGVTGGHFQYRPLSTPSCIAWLQFEAHFCPQLAQEAAAQTLHFFATAAAGAAELVSPLTEEAAP
jgi:tellurite resistance protein TerC